MLLLVTGASGAGKSTAREMVAADLRPAIECVECRDVLAVPAVPTVAWRQSAAEASVARALALQQDGRHLMLAGDPVAAGEVVAAPSADRLEGIAVCLLDIDRAAQAARLARRGDPPELLDQHVAFASWMREHVRDPSHMPEVLTADGWEPMRWERWTGGRPPGTWAAHVMDVSRLSPDAVATELRGWVSRALTRRAPVVDADPNRCALRRADAGDAEAVADVWLRSGRATRRARPTGDTSSGRASSETGPCGRL